jgi:hypothetical protein
MLWVYEGLTEYLGDAPSTKPRVVSFGFDDLARSLDGYTWSQDLLHDTRCSRPTASRSLCVFQPTLDPRSRALPADPSRIAPAGIGAFPRSVSNTRAEPASHTDRHLPRAARAPLQCEKTRVILLFPTCMDDPSWSGPRPSLTHAGKGIGRRAHLGAGSFRSTPHLRSIKHAAARDSLSLARNNRRKG